MRFLYIQAILLLFTSVSFASVINDGSWCQKNGGKIEFNQNYKLITNCITNDIYAPSYQKKLYNIICTPYFSSLKNDEEPLFLKVVSNQQNLTDGTIFDKYNYKTTENELVRYI